MPCVVFVGWSARVSLWWSLIHKELYLYTHIDRNLVAVVWPAEADDLRFCGSSLYEGLKDSSEDEMAGRIGSALQSSPAVTCMKLLLTIFNFVFWVSQAQFTRILPPYACLNVINAFFVRRLNTRLACRGLINRTDIIWSNIRGDPYSIKYVTLFLTNF